MPCHNTYQQELRAVEIVIVVVAVAWPWDWHTSWPSVAAVLVVVVKVIVAVEEHGTAEAIPKLEGKNMFTTLKPKPKK